MAYQNAPSAIAFAIRSVADAFLMLTVLLAVWAQTASSLRSGEPRSQAERLLRACLKSEAAMEHVSMRLEENTKMAPLPNRPSYVKQLVFFRRDGDLLDVSMRVLPQDKMQEVSFQSRAVFGKKYDVEYQFNIKNEKKPRGGLATTDRNKRFASFLLSSGSVLDGYFGGSDRKRLAEFMLEADDLRIRGAEVVAGILCQVVVATTPYGRLSLWIAEDKGSIPLKVTLDQGPDNLHISERVPLRNSNVWELGLDNKDPLVRSSYVLDEVLIEKTGHSYVPVAGRLTEVRRLKSGRTFSHIRTFKRTEVEINPDFSGTDAFETDLPNGSQVNNLDDKDSGVVYMWQDGEVVPAATRLTGAKAEAFFHRRPLWVTVIWVVIALFVLAAGVWLVIRLRAAKES